MSTTEVYQKLMNKSDACELKAIKFKEDLNLKTFWHNASVAFKNRALSLIIEEDINEKCS